MKRDKKVRPDRTSGVKAESDDYEIEKGPIRLFLAGHQAFANSNRRPHWLAKVVKKLLSHSDILNAAAKGKASFDVVREAEESQTIGRLAAMSADEFADGLMAGTLGGSGESLDPLTRTVFSLSLEYIPAGWKRIFGRGACQARAQETRGHAVYGREIRGRGDGHIDEKSELRIARGHYVS